MSEQCDAEIVALYDRSFTEVPLRRYVELPSLYQILGDVTGQSVLDFASGTGYSAKALRRRGAARVVGVDLSEAMIRATTAEEETEPSGIEYLHSDAAELARLGEHLQEPRTGRAVRRPPAEFRHSPNAALPRQVWLQRADCGAGKAWTAICLSVTMDDYTGPEIPAYWWSKESQASALSDAGLTDTQWVVPRPSADGIEKYGADFWADVIQRPFELIVTGKKSLSASFS